MSDESSSGRDPVGGFFGVLALAAGILSYIWLPLAFAPIALVCLVIAIMITPKYRALYQVAVVVITIGVVVGTAIAVIGDNPIY